MSVLLPLQEERAAGKRCVRAWTEGQIGLASRAFRPREDRRALGLPIGVLSFERRSEPRRTAAG
jgi:hypothetical protein